MDVFSIEAESSGATGKSPKEVPSIETESSGAMGE